MKKYRAAIVGCGRIASTFAADPKRKGVSTHAQAYQKNRATELVAACDLDETRLNDFSKRWGVKNLYRDFREMLEKEKIDFVSICTWNASHEALARQAVDAGVRGLVCEKPIADTLLAADKMIQFCSRKKIPLLVNYTRRYVKLYHQVKKMLESGEFGRIQGVSAYYTAGAINTATHLFDFLRYFFGDVDWVFADPAQAVGSGDVSYSGYLHFKAGFVCTLTALDVSDYLVFEADIYGSKKRLRLTESGSQASVWKAVPHPMFSGYKALKEEKGLSGDLSEGLLGMIENLVQCAQGKQTPFCSGEDGLASLEIAAALRESFKNKGKIVKLPLKNRSAQLSSK